MPARLRVAVLVVALFTAVLPAGAPAQAAGQPRGKVLFPTNALTVADGAQLTGRRLDFPLPNCRRQESLCNERRLLNQLDGFDLDPLISVQLQGAPDLANLERRHFYVKPVGGTVDDRIKINRLVYNPRTERLYGHPRRQLREGTTYVVVWNGAGPASVKRFTTLSASRGLSQMRQQLDDGSAYRDAGIGADERSIDFEILPEGGRAVFDAPEVLEIIRYKDENDQEGLVEEAVLNSARSGARSYGFGYFNSPQWINGDRFIPHTPTRSGAPAVQGSEKVGITLILPASPMPEGGYPTAIFGPGITRSKYDLFLAADNNANRGIATVSFDPVGHNFGPEGETGVTTLSGGGEVRFSGFGRAKVVDENGVYDPTTNVSTPGNPHRLGAVALRDGLRQTAADVMALVRAIENGVDVDGDGTPDLRQENVAMYAQSLGGIYGTLVTAVDPRLEVAALNVPGGPIATIATLSPGFRPAVSESLGTRRPSLLNGGVDCFTESAPLWAGEPETKPARGAIAIQEYASRSNWLNRPGSPEALAPMLRVEPLPGQQQKRVLYQYAFGDVTVPNPTSANIMRAGHLAPRTTYYRNDRTPTASTNPHGFLLDPRVTGREQGQQQVLDFIASNGENITDPDGPGNVFEVPIADKAALEQLNYDFEAQASTREEYSGPGCPE